MSPKLESSGFCAKMLIQAEVDGAGRKFCANSHSNQAMRFYTRRALLVMGFERLF